MRENKYVFTVISIDNIPQKSHNFNTTKVV